MARLRTCLVLVLVMALASPAAGRPAAGDAISVADPLTSVRALTAGVRSDTASLRAAATEGLGPLLAEAIRVGGGVDPEVPPPFLPPSVAAALANMPPALGAPLADLAAAVHGARVAVEAEIADVDPRALQDAVEGLGALPVVEGVMPVDAGRGFATDPARAERALRATAARTRATAVRAERLIAPILDAVDRSVIEGAALGIARALDRTMPALQAAAHLVPATGRAVEGCDVLDLTPHLCVGGRDANRYTDDQALLVDLGGDDTYENAAGGVNPVDPRVGGPAVSVNLDLGGNDTYLHQTPGDIPQPAQGAALIGVGILVDAGGNDTYAQRLGPIEDPDVIAGISRAQGSGSLAGVGLLADLGGSDRYEKDVRAVGPAHDAQAYGQGQGIAGLGVLLDAGSGDDTYHVRGGVSGMAPPNVFGEAGSRRSVAAQGTGSLAGTGVLIDGGGNDDFEITGATDVPSSYTDYEMFAFPGPPAAELRGQGVGVFEGAFGALLTGTGRTNYTLDATGTGLGAHAVYAHGLGLGGGTGVIEDRGGDDTYTMSTEMHASLKVDEDGDAEAVLWGFSPVSTQNVLGQGFAFHGLAGQPAAGLMLDHAGNDRYVARHAGTVSARATSEEGDATATAVSFDGGLFWVQGSAVDGSVGVVYDEAGDDEYVALLDQQVSADATSADPEAEETALAIATPLGPGFVDAQGATSNTAKGVLADLGGRDRYDARALTRAHASPTPGGAVAIGGQALFQGSGPDALLLDVDSGEQDTFRLEPNFEDTCTGHRGEEPGWQECARGQSDRPDPVAPAYRPLGTGIVDSAPTKGVTAVAFDQDQAAAGEPGGGVEVGGVLTGPGGDPLAGRVVEVRSQHALEGSLAGLGAEPTVVREWWDLTAAHAVTDEDGRWRVVLRLADPSLVGAEGPFRLWAAFHGEESLRGAGASVPFTFA